MTQVEEYDYEALPENSSLSASLVAGALAGIAEHAVMYPVDSIKVKRTSPIPEKRNEGGHAICNESGCQENKNEEKHVCPFLQR